MKAAYKTPTSKSNKSFNLSSSQSKGKLTNKRSTSPKSFSTKFSTNKKRDTSNNSHQRSSHQNSSFVKQVNLQIEDDPRRINTTGDDVPDRGDGPNNKDVRGINM